MPLQDKQYEKNTVAVSRTKKSIESRYNGCLEGHTNFIYYTRISIIVNIKMKKKNNVKEPKIYIRLGGFLLL